jgi:hypothetical protein
MNCSPYEALTGWNLLVVICMCSLPFIIGLGPIIWLIGNRGR